jgi:hypothetical protein
MCFPIASSFLEIFIFHYLVFAILIGHFLDADLQSVRGQVKQSLSSSDSSWLVSAAASLGVSCQFVSVCMLSIVCFSIDLK